MRKRNTKTTVPLFEYYRYRKVQDFGKDNPHETHLLIIPVTGTASYFIQYRSKGNISGGARKCWRREPLGGSGGMVPQKNLKSRDLEMLFPAFSKSYL